jgi:hypothetical protein
LKLTINYEEQYLLDSFNGENFLQRVLDGAGEKSAEEIVFINYQ